VSRNWQRNEVYPWLRLPRPGVSAMMVWLCGKNTDKAVTAPIVGLNSEARINDMVEAVNLELTEEERKELEEAYVPRPIAGHS
jgi:1-deoxyxylulose-5-phosphate synthase